MIKYQFIVGVLFFLTANLFGQVVYSDPPYATAHDSIVVYFDATQGDAGLMGYTGDIWAHTGVITSSSTVPSDWKYVVAPWNTNIPKAKMTRIATDLYKLNIGYPYGYYGITNPAEKILKLAFVFRNSDGSVTGRDVGGADIFLDLYEPGLTVVLTEPQVDLSYGDPQRSPVFANPVDTVAVTATAAPIGTEIDSLSLYIDQTLAAQTSTDTLHYTYFTAGTGSGYRLFSVVGRDTSGIQDTTSFFVLVNPPVNDAPVPIGAQDGINYNSSSSVTLSLFAPYKKFVYLIGDFNDWKIETQYFLNRQVIDADSVRWWITLENLTPGQEYAFQYFVDGDIRIADPYTDKILDPWNDQYISASTYPNLKPYPQGKTEQPVSVLQTDQTPFNWVYSDTFHRVEKNDLVIYEMLLRDFLGKHDYATLKDTLDYFERLGVTAIELMPISEFEGNLSWGYNPSFYFAPDKYYGPKNDLKAFVDACHQRGIAVIMDMVLNHSYGLSPLVRLYWDSQNSRPSAQNPWYNQVSPNSTYSWGYDFNHQSPATQKFVDRVNRYWMTQYKIDGFRFDFTKGFTNKPGDGWAYDAQRIGILERMADKIWETDSSAYVILEHFTENSEEKVLAEYSHGMMLWGNTHYNYNEATMGYNSGGNSDFSWGYYGSRGWSKPNLVTYMESHDEERLMFKNLAYGNSSSNYNVQDTTTALQRMKIVNAFFLTYPGPKMIWQFGELGYDYSIDYNGRTGEKPIRWDYLDQERRVKLFKTVAALIKLRRENEVFTSPSTIVNLSVSTAAKRIVLQHPSMNVSIIGNFDVKSVSINPNFTHPGKWYDYFSGDSLEITGSSQPVSLNPGEFHIFTDKKLATPESGIIAGITEGSGAVPLHYNLLPNYPNPFNPSTTVQFELPKTQHVQMLIFNLLGQQIKTLADKTYPAGSFKLKWNGTDEGGKNVSSGIYILHFKAGDFVENKRMVLLR